MQSFLLIWLLIFQISYSEHPVCYSNDPSTLVKVHELTIKPNHSFKFKIDNYANPATIIRNTNGTFLVGDFSTLHLLSSKHDYQYISTSLSFKYHPQHRIAQLNNQMLELQIIYELNSRNNPAWKHKRIGLSVTFLLTEYAPEQIFTLGKQINAELRNGSLFDLKSLLPLIPQLPMVLYKGRHTDYPQDQGFLWLARKQLLLMSQFEFEQVKSFMFYHQPKESINYHGLLSRISDLNEIHQIEKKEMAITDIEVK